MSRHYSAPLTSSERAAFAQLNVAVPHDSGDEPFQRSAAALIAYEMMAGGIREASYRSDLSRGGVRYRLTRRQLLGWQSETTGRWIVPSFQFDGGLHELPEWPQLLAVLPDPDETAPLVLIDWLTSPREHLGGRSRAEELSENPETIDQLLAEAELYNVPA